MSRLRRYDSLTVILGFATGFAIRTTFDYRGWWLVGHVAATVITGIVFLWAYRRDIQHGMVFGDDGMETE